MSADTVRTPIPLTVRTVQVVLGILWIGDGLLQLQPTMFTSSFAHQVLAPSAEGQPSVIAWPMHELDHLVALQPIGFNAVFAAAQLLIGVGLLARATVRPALALSMAWVAGVWALGEGFGMLFTGSASPLTGAPGGVLLYGIIGVVAWPRRQVGAVAPQGSAASGGILGETGARLVWAVLWVGSAVLWLLPANRASGAVSARIVAASANAPAWLAHLDQSMARSLSGGGTGLAVGLAVVSVAIGIGPLLVRRPTAFLVAGVAVALDFWLLGQSLGGLTTGTATDPNTGPLVVLLALALVPSYSPAAANEHAPAPVPVAVGGALTVPPGNTAMVAGAVPVPARVGATPVAPPAMRH